MDPLSHVADAAHVREGPEAVRRILTHIARAPRKKLSTRKAARGAQLPVPVTAAVLRELAKLGLVVRDRGTMLTDSGSRYAREHLGLGQALDAACPHCGGSAVAIGPGLQGELRLLRGLAEARPPVDWALDQSHATPATSLRRALLLHERGDLEGRSIIFMGDDDATSLAAGLLLRKSGGRAQLTVLEYDQRLVQFLGRSAEPLCPSYTVHAFDLLWRLPESIQGRHDVALCDPPYTLPGLKLFVSRAIDALRPGAGRRIYLSYPRKSPDEALAAQRWLAERGLLVREAIRGFNRYHGASILANQSDMLLLETTSATSPDPGAEALSDIYTYSHRTRESRYRCRSCGLEHTVGPRRDFVTIQDLKAAGCPGCSFDRFDRIAGGEADRKGGLVSGTATS